MATLDFTFPDELVSKLGKAVNEIDGISEKALKAGAEIIENEMRRRLVAQIGEGADERSTGDLVAALGTSPIKINHEGNPTIRVGFAENRTDGKTNEMLMNIREFGRSNRTAFPLIAPTRRAKGREVQTVMEETINRGIDDVK
jgi:Bacteriophage protein of unknown function (DUF646).